MGHIDPGHWVSGQEANTCPGSRIFKGPSEAQAGHRAMMAPGINNKFAHALILAKTGRGNEVSAATIHRRSGIGHGA